jgi:hydrogenase small subunit
VTQGPTGAVGLEEAVPEAPNIVNLGGCPHNPANTVAVLTHFLTFGELPALDQYRRPLFAYGDLIHDQCERRAYFDAGLFAEQWGDEGHRKGHCLYKLGCKGPPATYNCPNVRWNDGTSWPVQAGHGCVACASHKFWDNHSPFYGRIPEVPGFGSDTIGLVAVAGVTGATAAHAVGKYTQARRSRAATAGVSAGAPPPVPPEERPADQAAADARSPTPENSRHERRQE